MNLQQELTFTAVQIASSMQKKSVQIAVICGIAVVICSFAVVWWSKATQFRSTPAPPDEVVIEVKNSSKGLYCFVGELLLMRVGKSGRIEYEVVESESVGGINACRKSTIKTAEFPTEKLETLVNLASNDEVWKAKDEYVPFAYGVDTQDDLTTLLRRNGSEKRITIHNPNTADPRAKGHYPPGLFQLLLEVNRIRGYLR